jgi:hypothetical protein
MTPQKAFTDSNKLGELSHICSYSFCVFSTPPGMEKDACYMRCFRGKTGGQTMTSSPFLACFGGGGKQKRGGNQKDLVSDALQISCSSN